MQDGAALWSREPCRDGDEVSAQCGAAGDGVPPPLVATEVVVVARPGLSWAGKTRLFGDELAFRLRPKADEPRYEIAEIVEDFRLP